MADDDRDMTRAEAAEYLTSKGHKTQISTLAKYAGDNRGPAFTKAESHNKVLYRQSELDRWLIEGPAAAGGRPRTASGKGELLEVLHEFLPMVDNLLNGRGTFADGMRFTQVYNQLKRLAGRRGNGRG